MQLYNQMLLTAFVTPWVPKEVLTAGSRSLRFAQETVRTAIENGHLKECVITSRNGHQKMVEHFLTTTPSGIRFLIEQDHGKSWLSNIGPDDTKHAVSNPYSYTGKRVIRRMAKYAEARTFSALAGARSEPPFYSCRRDVSDEPDSNSEAGGRRSGKTYYSLICNAVSSSEKRERNEMIPGVIKTGSLGNEDIRFTGIDRIRELRRVDGREDNEHGPGTADGIIDSNVKSLLIYSGFGVGFNGDPWLYKSDIDMLTFWNQERITDRTAGPVPESSKSAVLLVKNRRHFELLYRDTAGLRKGEKLGNGFDRFHIVPKTYEGTSFLNHLMTEDSGEYEQSIIDGIISNMGMQPHTGRADGIFPLSDNGKLFAVGTEMDAIRMNHIERYVSAFPDTRFGIICYSWQTDYYRSIFGEIETIEISAG